MSNYRCRFQVYFPMTSFNYFHTNLVNSKIKASTTSKIHHLSTVIFSSSKQSSPGLPARADELISLTWLYLILWCLRGCDVAPVVKSSTHNPPGLSSSGLPPPDPSPPDKQHKPFTQFIKPFIQQARINFSSSSSLNFIFIFYLNCASSPVHMASPCFP